MKAVVEGISEDPIAIPFTSAFGLVYRIHTHPEGQLRTHVIC